ETPERVVLNSPSQLRVRHSCQSVSYCVEVRRYMQPMDFGIISSVPYNRNSAWTHHSVEPLQKSCGAASAGKRSDAALTHPRFPSPRLYSPVIRIPECFTWCRGFAAR